MSPPSRAVRFDERVAIVTGAGRGIGRAYALQLAARGARVVVNDVGSAADGSGADQSPAEAVVEEIAASGGQAVASHESVADASGAIAIVDTALETYGRVDVIINNAGIWRPRPFAEYAADEFQADLAVHLHGPWNVCRAAWQHMADKGYGRIINTVSDAGLFGFAGAAGYCIGKAAAVGLTMALAREGEDIGIRVNAIAPSAGTRLSLGPMFSEEQLRWRQTYLTPELVAEGVVWLAHDECTATGMIFSVFGGRIGRFFIGQADGYCAPPTEFDSEAVRDHFDVATDISRHATPVTLAESMQRAYALIGLPQPPT